MVHGVSPRGIGKDSTAAGDRDAKRAHVVNGTVHPVLVYLDGECVGWCQYGPPAEVATTKNPKAYEKDLVVPPDRRIGCVFTGRGHRRHGVARAGLAAALECHQPGGGGTVEACPEQTGRARTAARRQPAHRSGGPVRGVRLRSGPSDRDVALGHARDYPEPDGALERSEVAGNRPADGSPQPNSRPCDGAAYRRVQPPADAAVSLRQRSRQVWDRHASVVVGGLQLVPMLGWVDTVTGLLLEQLDFYLTTHASPGWRG